MSVSLVDVHIDSDAPRMTDEQIIKALECCDCPTLAGCDECCLKCTDDCTGNLTKATIDLINRQKAEIERLNKELEETQEKLEILLCEATGGLLSKHTYTVNTMTTYAHDYVLKCCDEAEAEAIKEFAEMVAADYPEMEFYLHNLVKEMVGEN